MTVTHLGYPAHWEADVVLRDGTLMRIRPIRPSDADALQAFHQSQSEESTYYRFFAPMERLSDRDLQRFTTVDHTQRVALVLVQRPAEGAEQIIAVGRFDRLTDDGDVAEVAFNVSDAVQGRGLGSILLEHLAAAGRELGVRRFVADVLPANKRMLRVFTDAGYETVQNYADGVVEVSIPIRPTERSWAVLAERERRAEALSMTALLAADGALVFGAGAEGELLADRVLRSIRGASFSGPVVSVASTRDLEGYTELPTLAFVAAPAHQVLSALGPMADRGVRAIVLATSGFSADGPTRQTLLRQLREHGLRLVGPRSFGVLAHGAHGPLPVTLAPDPITPGVVGLFCQSTSAARSMLGHVRQRGLGLASFLAAGMRADISGNDTMQYWTTDERTRVACLFLESIGNPRKFSRVARRLAATKPVVVAIAGTTGQQQLPGHPVRRSSAPRRVLEQMMRQAGVLLAGSVAEQLDWAMLLATQPLPTGQRVLLVSNSGSQIAVLGDLVEAHGMRLSEPVTMTPTVTPEDAARAVTGAAERTDWDMAIVAYGPFGIDAGQQVAAAAAELAERSGRPVAGLVQGRHGLDPHLRSTTATGQRVQVPGYGDGASAVAALAAASRYAQHREEPASPRVERDDVDVRQARDLIRTELAGVSSGTSVRLSAERTAQLLAAYGLQVWPAVRVSTLEDALAAAEQVGWPVALKAHDEILRHRADLGGVRLDLSGPQELAEAYRAISARMSALGRTATAVEVQRMAPPGAPCVVGGTEDELYGPIISFGLAGDAVELLDDVAYRIPPLTDADVSDLVRAVKAAPRLLGYRGLPALDVAALEEVIVAVSLLKEEHPQVRSVQLNPVLVAEEGVSILSATIDLAQTVRPDFARRVLP